MPVLENIPSFVLAAGNGVRSVQQRDDLDVGGLGKHVEGLKVLQRETLIRQAADIPRLRCRVAGDVDDPCRTQFGKRGEQRRIAAGSRRIEDEDVDPLFAGDKNPLAPTM